jgi:hypothetical protein
LKETLSGELFKTDLEVDINKYGFLYMIIDSNKVSIGSVNTDFLDYSSRYEYYFGLTGDDQLTASDMPTGASAIMSGGAGSDSYRWDGYGFYTIVETGGADDTYIDDNSLMEFSAVVNNKHLYLVDSYGNGIIYADYNTPSSRIEHFWIDLDGTGGLEHYTYDQFISTLMSLPSWLGFVSYQQIGLTSFEGQLAEDALASATQLSQQYEANAVAAEAQAAVEKASNNYFESISGDGLGELFDGGGGIDTVSFDTTKIELIRTATGFTVGQDALINIERLQFTDTSIALDIAGNAGTTAKILGAVFGKDSVSNAEYAGIGLDLLDKGMSYEELMELALTASGAATNRDVVDTLYQNLTGLSPSDADAAPYLAWLDDGAYSKGALGVFAAELELNLTNIDFVGLQSSGLEYSLI